MHPTFEAAHHVINIALDNLAAAITDVPEAALDYVPAEGANSIVVLTRHSLTATKFLAATAAGLAPDREAYREGARAASFRASGLAGAALVADIELARGRIAAILADGSEESLAADASWAWPDGRVPTGAELLIHTAGHLSEHGGQVQLLRDLWLAAHPKGS